MTAAKRKSGKAAGERAPKDGGKGAAHGRGGARWGLMEQRLFEVAARLFAERGFSATSLKDIADAMDISRPALYYYVKSKDEILAALVEAYPARNAAWLRALRARDDLDAAGKLREVVRTHVAEIAEAPERFRMLDRSEHHLSEPLAKRYDEARRAVLDGIRGVIEDGVASGEFRAVDARTAALAIIGMCNWVAWWFHPGDDHPAGPVADEIAEQAVRGVIAEQPAGAPEGPRELVARLREDLARLERLVGD